MGSNRITRELDVAAGFKEALRGVASTVSIITTHDGKRLHGMTATAVMSVSMAPPALAICINQSTLLHDILTEARRFCVNVLHESQRPVSAAFSGGVPPSERFSPEDWAYAEDGLGYLLGAQANLFCSKAVVMPYGTHSLFIGEVVDVRLGEGRTPLLYHNAAYCTPLPLPACA